MWRRILKGAKISWIALSFVLGSTAWGFSQFPTSAESPLGNWTCVNCREFYPVESSLLIDGPGYNNSQTIFLASQIAAKVAQQDVPIPYSFQGPAWYRAGRVGTDFSDFDPFFRVPYWSDSAGLLNHSSAPWNLYPSSLPQSWLGLNYSGWSPGLGSAYGFRSFL